MKALLHTAPYTLKFTDVTEPAVGPDDVLVRVRAVGICGSDVQGYTGKTGRRIPPIIMGHEAAGVVEAVGPNGSGLQPGDRVCFDSTIYCNQCEPCRQGQINYCKKREVIGVSVPAFKRHGAFAERVVVPYWVVIPMPESLSFEQAAMLEPVSIGVHAVNRGGVKSGDTVVVIGAGTIGQFVLQAAKLKGADKVIMSDLKPSRLELARQLGADVTIRPDKEDLKARVFEETDGRGADVSFEVVGFAPTLQQAISVTRTGGCVTMVGNLQLTAEIPMQEVTSRELTLRGTYANSGEYRDCVDLVSAGKIQVMPLVSASLPLSEGQLAFDRLYAAKEDLLKIILNPTLS